MKTLLIVLLCASLAANAVLLVRYSISHRGLVSSAPLPSRVAETHAPSPSASSAASAKIDPETARLLAVNDPEAIRRLHALGYSLTAIRAIAAAQVAAQFRDRFRALDANRAKADYWKSNYQSFDPKDASARMELHHQQEAALKQLLGDDYVQDLGPWASRYGNLAPAKVARVRAIEEDYQSMIMSARGNPMTSAIQFPEEEEKLSYLRKEEREELKQALSPDELLEFDLRDSPSAYSLRFQLSAFEPTEQEFRDMFKLRQDAEARANLDPYDASTDGRQARMKADADFNERLKTLLPADRYAEYQLSNDFDYKRFYQIAARLELPRESAVAAEAVKTSTEEKRTQLLSDPASRAPDKRTDALNQLAGDAEASLRRILGDAGYEAYRASPNNFLQRLRPRPGPVRKG